MGTLTATQRAAQAAAAKLAHLTALALASGPLDIAYERISRDKEGRELGVTRQHEDNDARADRDGATIAEHFVDNDRGASSRSKKPRPEFDAMIALAEAGHVRTIYAYSLSRLTRRPAQWEILIQLAERHGVKIRTTVSGDPDLTTADGRAVARTIAAWDAAEAERTAERLVRAHRQRREAGGVNWPRRPFGHERDGSAREAEAEAIRWAARAVVEETATLTAVAARWNADGIPTTTGRPWTLEKVSDVLRSRRLAALNDDGTPGAWTAILTPARWRAMVAVLDERGRKFGTKGTGRQVANLLSGIAVCGVCQRGATVRRHPTRGRLYICPDGHVQVPADGADELTREWLATGRMTGRIGAGEFAALRPTDTDELEALAAERDRLTGEIADTTDAIRAGQAVRVLLPLLDELEKAHTIVLDKLAAAEAAAARARSLPALLAEFADLTIDGQRSTLRAALGDDWVISLRPFVVGETERVQFYYVPDALDQSWAVD